MRRWSEEFAYARYKARGRVVRAVVWRLPHEVIMWSAVRLIAHGTTGAYSGTVVSELAVMEALKRWDDLNGGDRRYGTR